MSVNIPIKGIPDGTFRGFFPGVQYGYSLQITIEGKHLQLHYDQVVELAQALAQIWNCHLVLKERKQ